MSDTPYHIELESVRRAFPPGTEAPALLLDFAACAALAGRQSQPLVLRRGRPPVEEAAAVEPLLRRLRDEMWQAQPALGLWYSMVFGLYADGRIMPRFDYETRPMISDLPADLSEAGADLVRAPRPERWVPDWLVAP